MAAARWPIRARFCLIRRKTERQKVQSGCRDRRPYRNININEYRKNKLLTNRTVRQELVLFRKIHMADIQLLKIGLRRQLDKLGFAGELHAALVIFL